MTFFFFFYFLSFARLNMVAIAAREQSKAESDFFLISLSQGYISTAGGTLNFPLWVAPPPAEVGVISVHFQLQCETKQVQETPGRL